MSTNEHFGVGAGSGIGIKYEYKGVKETGGKTRHHVVEAVHPEHGVVGHIEWTPKHIHDLRVDLEHRRQGIATGLWDHAHSVANGRTIPAPKHSPQRTTMGDAWSKTVGGTRPRLDTR